MEEGELEEGEMGRGRCRGDGGGGDGGEGDGEEVEERETGRGWRRWEVERSFGTILRFLSTLKFSVIFP